VHNLTTLECKIFSRLATRPLVSAFFKTAFSKGKTVKSYINVGIGGGASIKAYLHLLNTTIAEEMVFCADGHGVTAIECLSDVFPVTAAQRVAGARSVVRV
jgi:hypothetical protein